nr:ATP-binding protein [Thermoanaerobaculia bacterium]
VAVAPYLGEGGKVSLLVETSLPTSEVRGSVAHFLRRLGELALVATAVSALSGLLLARRVTRPIGELREAAERAGRGDLATPIPRASGAETATLAATMEEMRRRLLATTAELKRRQAEAEAILGGIREGVFAVDRERRVRYLNPQAARLLGVRQEEALGRFCGDLLNPRRADGTRPCDEACPIVHARFRGPTEAVEHLELESGERRAVVVVSAPPGADAVSADDRQFQVLRDETELEATRRLRDAVVANVSHEFKTPLAAQLASIELLASSLSETRHPEALELVGSLERGTLRLTQLVDNLLESVRIEAGQLSIRRQTVALDEVIEEAVELTSPLLAQREQQLEVELPYPLPPVVGDPPRLAQVFVNLLANANKYAPVGSTIRLRGELAGATISLWVEDQGPGLPPGGETAVFERFFRSPGEEPGETGMGLGLAIVKSIVERHGGTVAAEQHTGGSRFRVRLPVLEAA